MLLCIAQISTGTLKSTYYKTKGIPIPISKVLLGMDTLYKHDRIMSINIIINMRKVKISSCKISMGKTFLSDNTVP